MINLFEVLIVGKKKMLNELLEFQLQSDDRINILDTTTSIEQAKNLVYANQPDLVLMTNFEGDTQELNLLSYISNGWKDRIKVAVLNSSTHSFIVKQALLYGVASYITYEYTLEELIESLIQVCRGKLIYPHVMNLQNDNEFLTSKEKEILKLISDGKTNQEISKLLLISKRTVEYHISAILQKLEAKTRVHAVVTALKTGIL